MNSLIVLISFYVITDISLFRYLANFYSLALFLISFLSVLKSNRNITRDVTFFISIASIFLLILNALLITDLRFLPEVIKVSSIFVFFLLGRSLPTTTIKNTVSKMRVLLFISIPILLYIAQIIISADGLTTSIFVNKNNAGAFTVMSIYALYIYNANNGIVYIITLFVLLAYNASGALISFIFSLIYCNLKLNVVYLFSFLLIVVLLSFTIFTNPLNIAAIERLNHHFYVFYTLYTTEIIFNIDLYSYAEYFLLFSSSDLSLVFRLKHWSEIYSLFLNGNIINILFGHGFNHSINSTSIGLVPHNDYIRFFYEFGLILGFKFIIFNIFIVRSLNKPILKLPAVFLFIYFFSENLINNYILMSFSYFIFGLLYFNREEKNARS